MKCASKPYAARVTVLYALQYDRKDDRDSCKGYCKDDYKGDSMNKNVPTPSSVEMWVRGEIGRKYELSVKKKRGVCLLVLNAIATGDKWTTYARGNSKLEDKRYNKWQVTNKTFAWCADLLHTLGWIENVTGNATPVEEDQSPSMFKATPLLLNLLPISEVEYIKKLFRESYETIILRSADKEDIGYRDNMERKQMRTVVRKLNLCNEKHTFTHNGELLNNSNMVRIFNETFEQGGRFYRCDTHLIKQRDNKGLDLPPHLTRVGMLIDGEQVVEVDFSCLHPTIVCAKYNILEEKYLAKDFYSTFLTGKYVGADRQLFKLAVNIMYNATSVGSASKAIQEEITKAKAKNNKEHIYSWHNGQAVVHRVFEVMPDMLDFFCTPNSYGRTLQYLDSCITERIIEKFIALDKPVVPVHDSYVVKVEDEMFLCDTMEQAFRHTTGNNDIMLTLKIKRHNGEEKVMLC